MHTISTISILAAVSHVSLGVTFDVVVGENSTFTFSPNAISGANVGDTITFQFRSNNHSVTQSSFIDPCHRPTLGAGISSGFQLITNPIGLPEYSFTLNTTAPLWFFCAQTQPFDHCQMGMVFAINPTPDETFDMFQSTAQHGPLFSASLSTISSSAFPGTSPSTSMMRTSPFPVGSVSPSLPPTSNDKLKVPVPVGAIVGSAVGGVMVLCATIFLLWRHNRQQIIGRHDRINTNTTPPHITPFGVTPSGSAMVETNDPSPNAYNSLITAPPKSNPLAVGDLSTTPRTRYLNNRKVQPHTPPILRMHEDSGMRGVPDEIMDVPPSYTSQ